MKENRGSEKTKSIPRRAYHCSICGRKHRDGTKIFDKHFQYANDIHL